MKSKYEQIIAELKRNASSDKDFITAEFKKQIAKLEKEIEELKAQFAAERDALMSNSGGAQKKLEELMAQMKKDFAAKLAVEVADFEEQIRLLKEKHAIELAELRQ